MAFSFKYISLNIKRNSDSSNLDFGAKKSDPAKELSSKWVGFGNDAR